MVRKLAAVLTLTVSLSSLAFAQGLVSTASKDDWEEINFEFNSAILADGYPSLLRLGELLNKNADHKVKLTGHTDYLGSHPFNDQLALSRAAAVKSFLEKYGAGAGQISTAAQGKRSPKVQTNTLEGRFINRRVEMTVTDGQGRVVGAGGVTDAIRAMEALQKKQEECCSQILRRLDKLDEIMAMLRDLKTQNQQLQKDVNDLKARGPAAGASGAAGMPAGASGLQAGGAGAGAMGPAGAAGQTVAGGPGMSPKDLEDLADKAAKKAVDTMRGSGYGKSYLGPRFTLLGLNGGADGTGNITFSGRGRVFAPFTSNFAFQGQGEYLYFRDRKEGQFDAGLVARLKNIQVGGFSSFKTVSFRDMQSNGTLGQFAFTGDYLFKHGKVGLFGTKSFLDNAVVNRQQISRNILEEKYLRVVDQIGGQTTLALGKKAWFEGNLGYLHSRSGHDRPGGTARFVYPLNNILALTLEGGVNETMLGSDNNGRAVVGVMFGNFIQPRDFVGVDHPVPVDIPRVRFELLTRRTRTGNDPPVADAGPDQVGARAGTITLDGSGSFDPDGDPITFQWTQVAGTAVTLANATAARASFTAEEGQSYAFRLTVRDDKGGQGIARVSITTREAPKVRIIRFTSAPAIVRLGESATLNYTVENADSVTITGVSETLKADAGSVTVRPTRTTSYTLTARSRSGEDTAVTSVVVDLPLPRIIRFTANPQTIVQGAKTLLSWETTDTQAVEVVGVGTFGPSGSVEVMPSESRGYTLIARNGQGETSAGLAVTVNVGPRPRVIQFTANPMQIVVGDSTTLLWNVEDADEIEITPGLGKVDATGSRKVSPAETTVYTLRATNKFGTTSVNTTVEVLPRVKINSFEVKPTLIKKPGEPVTFTWDVDNAVSVFIDGGIGPRPAKGSLTNAGPITTTTYTLTAIGRGSTANASVTVTVQPPPPDPANRPPTAVIGPDITTSFTELQLDGSKSYDADGDKLTYSWRSVDGRGTIVNATSATPTVRLTQNQFNQFVFELTVTDTAGLISKATIRVNLIQPEPLK